MISDKAFAEVTTMFHQVSGIRLGEAKRPLVAGRLQKLAQQRGMASLDDYVADLMRRRDPAELATVVDKLTTNETYFFREPAHYDHLARWVAQRATDSPLSVWSAASSSGEEAYSIAMLLASQLGLGRFQILGTDLSGAMVERARTALYPIERARDTPPAFLKQWCRRGMGEYDGQLLVCADLRDHVRFETANLKQDLPPFGPFDVIFLRNVLIYFDNPGKVDIVQRVLGKLKPDGLLYTGHAESIVNLGLPVRSIAPAVYVHA